ncbi:unnamed protein product [Urochloa decumbens]|uniref:Cytochrome P450 n=1 Tax=Urochloa decumbens TaxID=240449 RepID=A0ABC8XZX7_9POAL
MHQLIWNKSSVFRWIHRVLNDMGADILTLKLGSVHVMFVTCPEIAREVLRKNEAVFFSRPATFASELFSYGYKSTSLTVIEDQWKKMKRMLTSEVLSPALECKLHGQRVLEADHLVSFCVSDYYPGLVGLDLDGHEKVAKGVMSTLDRLHSPIIDEKVHEWSRRREVGNRRDAGDILDVLVALEDADGQPVLSIDEIKAQTVELMFGSVVYPSNTVEWALAEMMNRSDVMQKAIDELDAVVGKERLVQESDISKLNYLKSCIREAFRLHPYHAINAPRVAMEDTAIAGYLIPKDSHVIVSRIGLGKNSKVWPEPLEFRPERHLNDGVVVLAEPDLRFVTFGTGRRGCPGVSLGTSFTMVLFARLLQGFSWTKPPGIDIISLQESPTSLALAAPLVLQAKSRLAAHLYVEE